MAKVDLEYEANRTLRRLRPKLVERVKKSRRNTRVPVEQKLEVLDGRLEAHWPRLFRLLYELYGDHYDFFYYLENILLTAVDCWLTRPDDLLQLDIRRENDPSWFLSEKMTGTSIYVDLFNGDLKGLKEKIPYFQELGITYLHLMPLFESPDGNSDGGYAVSDFRTVDPKLGSMNDLREVAAALREAGISLVLDFVFNHTSDEHAWAIKAQEGDPEYLDYYHIYPDRTVPEQYERHLREIFPTIRRGNFTWHEGMDQWVWTTFNNFQWDLRYSNPEVFRAMASEMLYLANTGVEILRLDAVAFIWKQMGTTCENLPEAHLLIQAYNAVCRIAAPGLIFKSEAIVHPDEVIKYISNEECQISYNPTLMALMWEAIATRRTTLLKTSLRHRQELPLGTAWVNYLRGHDDIGWSFANEDAHAAGIDPHGHRQFLNDFYTGTFPGSFASGVPFQHNEVTGDMRVCGTMASLAGLEQALDRKDKTLIDMAVRRIVMMHGVLCSMSGIPLLFSGQEWAVLNDYSYLNDPEKEEDSRWVHRPPTDWGNGKGKGLHHKVRTEVNRRLQGILNTRAKTDALRGNHLRLLPAENDHVLAYLRWHDASQLIVLANFSEEPQILPVQSFRQQGFAHFCRDLFTDKMYSTADVIELEPYELLWLTED
jgi:amylosucrase